MYVLSVDYQAEDAPQLFARSAKETGFAVITNHTISRQLLDDVYAEWNAFFESQDKHNYVYDQKAGALDGYFPIENAEIAKGNDIPDIKEMFQYYPWGKKPQDLSPNSQKLYDEMSTMAQQLLGWLESNTPEDIRSQFSAHLSEMTKDSPRTMLRVLYYPAFTGKEEKGAIRAAAHEDINMITLLPAATQAGLQVLDKHGNWQDVVPDYGSIIVNIGDMLQEASGHYYPSTTHRVINPTGEATQKARLSMPLFLHANPGVVLSERHTSDSYLDERQKELGLLY